MSHIIAADDLFFGAIKLPELLVRCALCPSKNAAIRLLKANAVELRGLDSFSLPIEADGRTAILPLGKAFYIRCGKQWRKPTLKIPLFAVEVTDISEDAE